MGEELAELREQLRVSYESGVEMNTIIVLPRSAHVALFIHAMQREHNAMLEVQTKLAEAEPTLDEFILTDGRKIPFFDSCAITRVKNIRQFGKSFSETTILGFSYT